MTSEPEDKEPWEVELDIPTGGTVVRLGKKAVYDDDGQLVGFYEDFADYDHASPSANPESFKNWLAHVERLKKEYD
jgi:hypothetical protein